jgi:tRNA threonylcarbamoyladenosine biosynthesis protein TsaB
MTAMMNGLLLALETSVPTARVAVLGPDGAVRATGEKTAARHSSNLLRLCDEALRAAGIDVAGLGAIACGAGPGSFTGLRVGLAVAKGLALPTGLPLVLIPSLEALAHDLAGATPLVVPCLDAGKDQVYAQLFRVSEDGVAAEDETWVIDPAALVERLAGRGAVTVGGTGVDRYRQVFSARLGDAALRLDAPGPSALSVGRLALARLARGEIDDLDRAVPAYGRPPDITRPKPRPPTPPRTR